VLLKVSPHSLTDGDVLIGGGGLDCHWLTFFYFFFLSSLENYSLTLFVVNISTSILFFILGHFVEFLFIFNFIIPS
jgi:hypothetical protein